MANENGSDQPNPLVLALAKHFEIDVDDLLNYAIIVKRRDGDKEIHSSVWPESVPTDSLQGIVGILRVHADRSVA